MSIALRVKRLPLESIQLDKRTQARAAMRIETVDEYAAEYAGKGSTPLPPVDVFHDGKTYWLADGWHRIHAAKQAGRSRIGVTVHEGGLRDAVLFAVSANAQHGLRRSNADKHKAVEILLKDEEWQGKSDRWIAEKCGVSDKFVGKVRDELRTVRSSPEPTKRVGKDGKARPAKQPRKKTEPAAKQEPAPEPTPDPNASTGDPETDEAIDAQVNKQREERKSDERPTLKLVPDEAPVSDDPARAALIAMEEDVERHMDAWRWGGEMFASSLEQLAKRARRKFPESEGHSG